MSSYYPDTIVAIATPPQNGAIGIIRLSGPKATEALKNHFIPHNKDLETFQPRKFYLGRFESQEGVLVDHALVVSMPGPNSFTGEDIVEVHCHGNQILLKNILSVFLKLPQSLEIRAAEPGEFTKRAFLNGKMDLTQAEAVHEIITASSDAGLKASLSNLDGRLKLIVDGIKHKLTSALALVEASLEFSEDENIQTYHPDDLLEMASSVQDALASLLAAYKTSQLYDHGVTVAIVGEPNVGKSSLLNALLVEDRAIVTDIPGTTRDVVEGARIIDGVRFVFKDTAGMRETSDLIELEGVRRSEIARKKADIVLEVVDCLKTCVQKTPKLSGSSNLIRVLNKIDVLNNYSSFDADCFVSAMQGAGIDELITILKSKICVHNSVQNIVHINERQRSGIERANKFINDFMVLINKKHGQDDLLAEALRLATYALDEVIGAVYTDAILSEIFSKFCIGK